jgi:hypothetical protein
MTSIRLVLKGIGREKYRSFGNSLPLALQSEALPEVLFSFHETVENIRVHDGRVIPNSAAAPAEVGAEDDQHHREN